MMLKMVQKHTKISIVVGSLFIFGSLLFCFINCTSSIFHNATAQIKPYPNVILVMTDDQGIGDLACHGNPWLKTPHLDNFYEQSVRLTNFHVSPLCTPTRAAIMSGQYPIHNGAWATFKGRAALREDTKSMAHLFRQNGYETAMFGKWHLGDNFPARPTDMGFKYAVHHQSGGIGEISDYWGNSYFNDVYLVNNQPQKFEGYCTDIWFNEAIQYITEHKDKPFFVYLPTNAPHAPLIVDEKYAKPYCKLEGENIQSADYYGMISNIDENFGRLLKTLKENKLEKNTILIFCSDNGTQFGYSKEKNLGYNKGFEGNKGDKLEGGHRVPFFIRWPAGGIQGGKNIDLLSTHVDLLPSLAKLCKIEVPSEMELDGIDISSALLGRSKLTNQRTVFIHHRQDWRAPDDLVGSCVMHDKWRLIDGQRLYNVEKDRQQKYDVASQHPQLLQNLLFLNKQFTKRARQRTAYQELPPTIVGSDQQKEITLTIQHAIGDDGPVWKQEQVAIGRKNKNNKHALAIAQNGKYRISCRRWPKECSGPIHDIPKHNPKQKFTYKSLYPEETRIKIRGKEYIKAVPKRAEEVAFELELKEGKAILEADFIEQGNAFGVYYIYIEKIA